MSSNKTLILSSEFPPGPGGIGQHAASMALALSESNEVVVLCNQDYTTKEEINNYCGSFPHSITVLNFSKRKNWFTPFIRIFQALKCVKSKSFNKIIVSGRFQLWIGALIKLIFPSQSVIGFAHGSEVVENGSLTIKITYWACSKLDRVCAVSRFTSDHLISKGLKNVEILHNGIDNELLLIYPNMVGAIPHWKGEPSLLTVGNVTLRKGQHRVIKALPKLLEKYPQLHYHIVGLPTLKDEMLNLATNIGVAEYITFHGRLSNRNELYRAYKSSDIFIMLSENQKDGDVEGFGIALLEANVFHVPTIGAKGCGIEDAISKESGILVDGDNQNEILDAIKTILGNVEQYKNGSRTWAEQHNWSALIKKI